MARYKYYIAISLLIHTATCLFMNGLPEQLSQTDHVPLIAFEWVSPNTQTEIPQEPVPQPKPLKIEKPQIIQTLTPIVQIATEPQTTEKPSQKSIILYHPTMPTKTLGLKPFDLQPATDKPKKPSDTEWTSANLRNMQNQFRKKTSKSSDGPKWFTTTAQIAQEGTAFYAATTAGNVPAMVAVVGLSLTQGSLKKGLGKTFSVLKNLKSSNDEPTDQEAILLTQIGQHKNISERDLYLSQPPGVTYPTLRTHLDNLVKHGHIVRMGNGTETHYQIPDD